MTKEQEVLKDLKEVTLEELDEAIRAVDKQEQEDSIEILENTELDINTIDNVDLYTYSMAVKTVLSMLKEKDKQIEEYRGIGLRRHKQQVQIKKSLKGIINNQNKIIGLMAEQLTTPIHDKEWIKQYYENKAKELLNK